MVAGGTGITPMYQLARAICLVRYRFFIYQSHTDLGSSWPRSWQDPGDNTEVSLLYANHTTKDILLRSELDDMARKYPQFKVWYTINERPPNEVWPFFVGRVVKVLRSPIKAEMMSGSLTFSYF